MNESDRWFHIEQDRKRERTARVRRAKKRAATMARREATLDRAFQTKTIQTKMNLTEWTLDEHGNLSRVLFGDLE